MQTVSIQDVRREGGQGEIQVGDRVEVVTRDREKFEFAVTDIDSQGIAGKFGFIPYENISRLSVRRRGNAGNHSWTWLWGVLGAAALVAIVASADSVSVCSGTPCPPDNP